MNSVASDRITLRTVLRDNRSSRQICLIDLPSTKCKRLIFAIVSTTNIPRLLPHAFEEASEQNCQGDHFWTPIIPLPGSKLHADRHNTTASFTHVVGGGCKLIEATRATTVSRALVQPGRSASGSPCFIPNPEMMVRKGT